MPKTYQTIKSKLLGNGKLFEDKEFPATLSSIFYKQDGSWGKDVDWKRPPDICDNPRFVVGETSKFDLDQGEVGNCWFISAAAELATKPELFSRVVPQDQSFREDYTGLFRFNFWRYGEWKEIVVDDRLPTRKGKLIFCHNREEKNEFWSALMEKAYAKVHGSYQALEGGYPQDALVDFTGGLGETIAIKDYTGKPDQLFKLLMRTFKMNSLICCATGSTGQGMEEKLKNGLVSTHAYSINNLVQMPLKSASKSVRLVRILNPWGKREWNRAWSDGSDKWKQLTVEQKKSLDIKTGNEGEFWMSFKDFMNNFENLNICHLSPGCMSGDGGKIEWSLSTHHGQWVEGVSAGGCGNAPNKAQYWTNPQFFVKLTDPDESDDVKTCTVIISLMQKYRRKMRTETKSMQYLNLAIGFRIYKFRGSVPEELDGENFDGSKLKRETGTDSFTRNREVVGRFDLEPGIYCIIPAAFSPDVQADFVLRVATEKPVDTGEVDSPSKPLKAVKPVKSKSKFDRLFERFAGDDDVVDAKELKKILTKGILQEGDDRIAKGTCRALVKRYSNETKGLLTKLECKQAWARVLHIQNIFEEFDVDDSGYLDRAELNNALKQSGISLSKKSLGYLVTRYCGKEGGLGWDDFVLIVVKIETLNDHLMVLARKAGGLRPSSASFDAWLETVL